MAAALTFVCNEEEMEDEHIAYREILLQEEIQDAAEEVLKSVERQCKHIQKVLDYIARH